MKEHVVVNVSLSPQIGSGRGLLRGKDPAHLLTLTLTQTHTYKIMCLFSVDIYSYVLIYSCCLWHAKIGFCAEVQTGCAHKYLEPRFGHYDQVYQFCNTRRTFLITEQIGLWNVTDINMCHVYILSWGTLLALVYRPVCEKKICPIQQGMSTI